MPYLSVSTKLSWSGSSSSKASCFPRRGAACPGRGGGLEFSLLREAFKDVLSDTGKDVLSEAGPAMPPPAPVGPEEAWAGLRLALLEQATATARTATPYQGPVVSSLENELNRLAIELLDEVNRIAALLCRTEARALSE